MKINLFMLILSAILLLSELNSLLNVNKNIMIMITCCGDCKIMITFIVVKEGEVKACLLKTFQTCHSLSEC